MGATTATRTRAGTPTDRNQTQLRSKGHAATVKLLWKVNACSRAHSATVTLLWIDNACSRAHAATAATVTLLWTAYACSIEHIW